MRSTLVLTTRAIGLCIAVACLMPWQFNLPAPLRLDTPVIAADEGSARIAFDRSDVPVMGLGPRGIVAEDLNHDEKIDLVVANLGTYQVYQSQTLDVFFGRGDGTFELAQTIPAGEGNEPYGIAAADLRQTGITDIIVPNKAGHNVSVFLGKGDGTFEQPASYATGDAWAVSAGDLDGDGIIDLAAGDFDAHTMSLLPGIGDGGFHRALTIPMPLGLRPRDFGLGDLDRDGLLDLVVPSDTVDGRIAIYLNKSSVGSFLFSGPQLIRVGSGTGAVLIHDLDGDQRADIVASSQNSENISVLMGNGDGTFRPPVDYWAGSIWPFSLALADFDADGHPDLVVSGVRGNRVAVLPGNGLGHFADAVPVPIEGPCRWVETADFDGDGKTDIAAGNYTLSGGIEKSPEMFFKTVSILLNRSALSSPRRTAFRVNSGGDDFVNGEGIRYERDTGFEGGTIVETAAPISDTIDDRLFQSAREGDFTYTAEVAPGRSYTVALYFAELTVKKPRKRLFNITINGRLVWSRFDIMRRAKKNAATAVYFYRIWPDRDSRITLDFSTVKRGALCSGLSIF
jgi:hypothetical protein